MAGAPTSRLAITGSARAGGWAATEAPASCHSRHAGSPSESRRRFEGAPLARAAIHIIRSMAALPLHRFTFRAMAGEHELQLHAPSAAAARDAADAAIADVARIEAKYSRYRDDSLTTKINRAAGGVPVAIDAETAALLRYADQCHTLSGGRFDLTSGVLRRAWNFRATPPRIPDEAALAAAPALVG